MLQRPECSNCRIKAIRLNGPGCSFLRSYRWDRQKRYLRRKVKSDHQQIQFSEILGEYADSLFWDLGEDPRWIIPDLNGSIVLEGSLIADSGELKST